MAGSDSRGGTPLAEVDAMQGTSRQQVNLAHPIPVLILYATVIVSEDGVVHFYDDIYKHDAALEKVLETKLPTDGIFRRDPQLARPRHCVPRCPGGAPRHPFPAFQGASLIS